MLKKFLENNRLLAYSDDFAGFIFKLKDCYMRFNLYGEERVTFFNIEPGTLPPFVSVHLNELKDSDRKFLYRNSENFGSMEKSSITVANSDCNLKCSYCLNHKRDRALQYPTAREILTVKEQYRGIETLEMTGGEPTQDMEALKEIIENAGPSFKRIHIYTNGLNLTQEFVQFLADQDMTFRLIIAVSTDHEPGGHVSVNKLYEILDRIKPALTDKILISINVLDAQGQTELKDVFLDLVNNLHYTNYSTKFKPPAVDTLKLTSPLCDTTATLQNYTRHIENLLMVTHSIQTGETPFLKGKPIVALNFDLFPSTRGNPECNLRKVSMFGPRVATCVYDPDKSKSFDNPIGLLLSHVKNNLCLKCSFYPYQCKDKIATTECPAYNQRCLKCPALNVCHNRCHLRGELTDEDCMFLSVVNAFELWLNIKDKTAEDINKQWNNKSLII